MRQVAILTSGGDAPGMNAAIWAAIKLAAVKGIHVVGVEGGYDGLIDGAFRPLTKTPAGGTGLRPVAALAWTAGTGGTFLGPSRCPRTPRQNTGRTLRMHSVGRVSAGCSSSAATGHSPGPTSWLRNIPI